MEIINIHQAKTHLSRLIERVVKGESIIIAKAGKPLVKVVPLDTPAETEVRRLGSLLGQFSIPEDFDRMGSSEIEEMFYGKP